MNEFARRHPQLSSEEMQQLKWLLGGLLTLLSVSTVFYMEIDAWALTILTSFSVVANVIRPGWLARIPRWVHRVAFPFIAGVFALDLWITGELLPSMVRLDVLLLLYRSLIYRQKRDDLQLIVLGLFLIVVAGVLTVSMVFAGHILAFAAVALVFLLAITLTEATGEPDSTPAMEPGTAPAWARHVGWRRLLERVRNVTDWRVVTLGASLFVGLVVLSGLLFLAIPRFQLENGLFLDRLITKKARTGFSDTIRFGDVTEIQQDGSVALSVDVSDRREIPADPYWRMLVLDEYKEGTFRLSPVQLRDSFERERSGMGARGSLAERSGNQVFWTFYLESGVSRFLPTPGAYELLRFREPQTYRSARRLGIIALRNEPVTMTAYRLEGLIPAATIADPGFAARFKQDVANPRAAASLMLAVGIGADDRAVLRRVLAEIETRRNGAVNPSGEQSTAQFAQAATAWLAERHAYSLQPKIPTGNGDPLVRWLDSTGGGHCELFAGSLVLLARSAGIPARVVTGFRGGSWNGYSNNFTLRNSDAHAWCELFDPQTATWRRADPTPGAHAATAGDSQGEAALAKRMDRSWKARMDSVRVFWYRRIVSFDQQSQFETLRAVKEATETSGKRIREAIEGVMAKLKALIATPWSARKMGGIALTAVVAVLVIMAVQRLRIGLYNFGTGQRGRRRDAVRRKAGRWLARLRTAAEGGNGSSGSTDRVATIAALQRLRFGPKETWHDVGATFHQAARLLRDIRRAPPRSNARD